MGKLLLIRRLVVKDIRRRPGQALLLVLAIATASTTLTLGLALRGATDNPFARTQSATNGPDVIAALMPVPPRTDSPIDAGQLAALDDRPGVAASSGPFPVTWTLMGWGQATEGAEVEGRSEQSSGVDQPALIDGVWVRPGGVVIEAGFADALGAHVGDELSLGGKDLKVVGIAVSAAVPDYPQVCAFTCILTMGRYNPGLIWTTYADTATIARSASSSPIAYYLNLKLTDPSTANTLVRDIDGKSPVDARIDAYTSQYVRDADTRVIANVQLFLFTGSSLLMLLALASVAVLVGGRMAEQIRRVGLLKAVGGTPRLVALVLLCENGVIGLIAAALGLLLGRLAAPSISGPGAGLLAAPPAPVITAATVVSVTVLALAVATAATFLPAVRAARRSTVASLNDTARVPRRRSAIIKLSVYLPASLLIGARLAVRRPRRLILTIAGTAVTVSGLVAMLIMHATAANPELAAPSDPLKARLSDVIVIISAVLVIVAAINAIFIAWTTVLETRHTASLARALGATTGQIVAGLTTAQVSLALIGALLGIPGGIGIYYAFTPHGASTAMPSMPWLALVVLATPLAIGLLTTIPIRVGAGMPVAKALNTRM